MAGKGGQDIERCYGAGAFEVERSIVGYLAAGEPRVAMPGSGVSMSYRLCAAGDRRDRRAGCEGWL
jgi:hypothetical protein